MPLIKFEGPDGPEAHAMPLGPNSLLRLNLAEVREIQRVTGLTAVEVRDKVFDEDPDPIALTALVQALWKRQGRIVKFDDVDFDLSTLEFDLLPEEQDPEPTDADEPAGPEPEVDGMDPTPASSGDATEAV